MPFQPVPAYSRYRRLQYPPTPYAPSPSATPDLPSSAASLRGQPTHCPTYSCPAHSRSSSVSVTPSAPVDLAGTAVGHLPFPTPDPGGAQAWGALIAWLMRWASPRRAGRPSDRGRLWTLGNPSHGSISNLVNRLQESEGFTNPDNFSGVKPAALRQLSAERRLSRDAFLLELANPAGRSPRRPVPPGVAPSPYPPSATLGCSLRAASLRSLVAGKRALLSVSWPFAVHGSLTPLGAATGEWWVSHRATAVTNSSGRGSGGSRPLRPGGRPPAPDLDPVDARLLPGGFAEWRCGLRGRRHNGLLLLDPDGNGGLVGEGAAHELSRAVPSRAPTSVDGWIAITLLASSTRRRRRPWRCGRVELSPSQQPPLRRPCVTFLMHGAPAGRAHRWCLVRDPREVLPRLARLPPRLHNCGGSQSPPSRRGSPGLPFPDPPLWAEAAGLGAIGFRPPGPRGNAGVWDLPASSGPHGDRAGTPSLAPLALFGFLALERGPGCRLRRVAVPSSSASPWRPAAGRAAAPAAALRRGSPGGSRSLEDCDRGRLRAARGAARGRTAAGPGNAGIANRRPPSPFS